MRGEDFESVTVHSDAEPAPALDAGDDRHGWLHRREFFSVSALLALAGTTAAASLFALGEPARAYAQRPPGAIPEREFVSRCIKCGQCIRACPYDAVGMAEHGSGVAAGTPYIVARKTPCYMCRDIPCMKACPTGALDKSLDDINKARMGLALLSGRETCIALQGLRCEVCFNSCPLTGKALTLDYRINERTGKHAIFEPVVHSDTCTGCGKCEHACILDKPAIRVFDRSAVEGELGKHYRFGWMEKGL